MHKSDVEQKSSQETEKRQQSSYMLESFHMVLKVIHIVKLFSVDKPLRVTCMQSEYYQQNLSTNTYSTKSHLLNLRYILCVVATIIDFFLEIFQRMSIITYTPQPEPEPPQHLLLLQKQGWYCRQFPPDFSMLMTLFTR